MKTTTESEANRLMRGYSIAIVNLAIAMGCTLAEAMRVIAANPAVMEAFEVRVAE